MGVSGRGLDVPWQGTTRRELGRADGLLGRDVLLEAKCHAVSMYRGREALFVGGIVTTEILMVRASGSLASFLLIVRRSQTCQKLVRQAPVVNSRIRGADGSNRRI